jgi:hypothetical protein
MRSVIEEIEDWKHLSFPVVPEEGGGGGDAGDGDDDGADDGDEGDRMDQT